MFRSHRAAAAITGLLLLALPIAPAHPQRLPNWTERNKSDALAERDRLLARYPKGPDSLPQPGVPRGSVIEFTLDESTIFPGTTRTIKLYVPAQYRASQPAALFVTFDDLGLGLPTVFDNLIHKGEMPVTIAVAIGFGTVRPARSGAGPRFSRSVEFDGLDDRVFHFLTREVLPQVKRRAAPGGEPIRLTADPNLRAAGGGSTGAIAAFTLGWQHPESFRRIYSAIGTYVGMRGGDGYPVLVRKTEPKPLRVFLQDTEKDNLDQLVGEVGDWHVGNLAMASALRFAGYDATHLWGEGGHDGIHAEATFPDAMRWLWRDWRKPIAIGKPGNLLFQDLLVEGEGWHRVDAPFSPDATLAAAPDGRLFVADGKRGLRQVGPDAATAIGVNGLAPAAAGFFSDGRLVIADAARKTVVVRDARGRTRTIAQGIAATRMMVTRDDHVYLTDAAAGSIWLIAPGKAARRIDTGLDRPSGIGMSGDGAWLAVAESGSRWGYSYRIGADGGIDAKERFYWYHLPDDRGRSDAGGLATDSEGRVYGATNLGIQIFDRNGRARAIMPVPGGGVRDIAFAGAQLDRIYALCADGRVYWRRLKVAGWVAGRPTITLPPWWQF